MTDTINSRDFVDIAAFYVAMGAVGDILLMRGKGEALPPDLQGMDLDSLDAQFQGAVPLLRRVGAVFDQGMEVLLGSALEKANLRVKTRLNQALRGNPVSQFRARSEFLTDILPRLGSHQGAVRDSIADVHGRMLLLCRAAGNSNPVARLFEIASLAPCSGHYIALKKWQTTASSLCGNTCPEHEVLAADLTEAAVLVETIRDIDRRLETKDPTDPTSVDLAGERAQAQGDLTRVIAESSDPRAVQTVVAQTVSQEKKYITRVANAIKGGLTPDQEECVISRGRVVIAAGAGSGKTRVLASKVVYHIQEAGLHAGNVMAVSFSRKSAGELKSRVFDYAEAAGAPLDRKSYFPGMGTTHSIARMILNQSGRFRVSASPSAPERERVISGSDIKNLIHVAIAQVQMKGGNGSIPADAMSFFPNLTGSPTVATPGTPSVDAISAVKSPVQNPSTQASPLDYYLEDPARYEYLITTALRALTEALGSIMIKSVDRTTAKGPARVFTVGGPGLSDFYGVLSNMVTPAGRMKFEKANPQYRSPDQFVVWAQQTVSADAFKAAVQDGLGFGRIQAARQELTVLAAMSPKDLTETQRATLQGIVTRPLVASRLKATGAPVARMATEVTTEVTEDGISKAADKQVDNLRNNRNSPYYYWFHNPANQWFNQGISPQAFETEDKNGNSKPVPLSEFTRYIGLVKNSMVAPGRAWTDAGDDKAAPDTGENVKDDQDTLSEKVLAAVYGAYEWLKGNVEHLKGRLDYDDQLIQASRVLTENPQVLRKLQMQYKCILVDEAQDLNKCQHVLFGLLAGYLDPGTIKPRIDGKMTADTFAFIGDDKQAIYEFRGALPGEFIRKSELVPDNEGFKTYLLDTNYRSGSEIVEAANRLIAHNTDQIPMVCKATPAKGMGKIVREQVGFSDEGPRVLTERILQAKAEAEAQGVSMKGFYKNFGLAVRTNGEVAMYAMAMIEAGIPFRSKKNFFGGPILGPLTSLLKLYIPGTPVNERNECVVKGVRAPNFGVNGKTLADKLEALRAGDYLEYLTTDKGYTRIYSMESMTEKMKAYVDYLEELEGLATKGNSRAMIDFILNYKTPDGSNFGEQLAAEVKNDEEEMEEVLMAAAEAKSEVTPEMLLAQALKPMFPIYAVAERYPKAKDFIGYLNSLVIKNQARNKTDAEDIDGESDTVTIDTVHGWKGLEVAHLFLPMEEDKFPHMMSSGTEEGLASERRLAYVGFTRGQQSVTIIEPKYRKKGEKVVELNPSQFAEEACIPLAGKAGGKDVDALRGDESDDVEGDRPMDREASCSDFDFPELNLEPDPEGTLLDLWGPTMDPKEIA